MSNFGCWVVPTILGVIILWGIVKKVPVFDVFLQGASEGISSTFAVAPSLVGLITAVTMLKASGALDLFSHFAQPLANALGFPAAVIPLAILRPISGSGSIALLDNIFKNFGADSHVGRLASVIMGSTETTFYTLAVYFGCVKIKDSRYAVAAALITDVAAIIICSTILKFL